MKIYTRTGDDGTTGLLGSERVWKDHARIEAYGTVDELNSALGIAKAGGLGRPLDEMIERIQAELFCVGAALADVSPSSRFQKLVTLGQAERLEREIDAFEAELEPLRNFILPGGALSAARLHLARNICRRAERLVVALSRQDSGTPPAPILAYLNRLSDWLFVAARYANKLAGISDIPWKGE